MTSPSTMADALGSLLILLVCMLRIPSTSQQLAIDEMQSNSDKVVLTETSNQLHNVTSLPVLSRKRRYVVFPRGSSLQCVYCETSRTYTPLTKKFAMGITMGLAWMLPTEAHELYLQKRDIGSTFAALADAGYGVLHRVDMYRFLESFLGLKDLNGRDCLMRAVCEASGNDDAKKQEDSTLNETRPGTFMEELLKILFRLPVHPKHKTPYHAAQDHAGKCGEIYSGCHSFLNLQIGK